MNLSAAGMATASLDAVGWISTVLLWILIAAAIVLAIVAIRLVMAKTRVLLGSARPNRQQPFSFSVSASTGATRNASPVPPENPHAPGSPGVGTPRVRV